MAEKIGALTELLRQLASDRRWRIGDEFFRLRREFAAKGGRLADCPFDDMRQQILRHNGHTFVGTAIHMERLLFPKEGHDED